MDESHAHKSPKLFRALEHGTAGRDNGLIVVISTAGDDFQHFYYSLLVRARSCSPAGTWTRPRTTRCTSRPRTPTRTIRRRGGR